MADPTPIRNRTAVRPYWARYDTAESGPGDKLVELVCSRAYVDGAVSSLRQVVDQAHISGDCWDTSFAAMLALIEEGERLEALVNCFER